MKTLRILLLIVACSPILHGQEQTKVTRPDTLQTGGIILLDPGIALGKPTLLLPQWLKPGATLDHPSFFYSTSRPGVPPMFLRFGYDPKIDLTASLRLQQEKEKGLQVLYSVLGAVTVGGVAYLAYRHVRKYGF